MASACINRLKPIYFSFRIELRCPLVESSQQAGNRKFNFRIEPRFPVAESSRQPGNRKHSSSKNKLDLIGYLFDESSSNGEVAK
jgi:hypothetical protein